jgi:hypothetical protein
VAASAAAQSGTALNTALTHLDIGNCRIGEKGAIVLSTVFASVGNADATAHRGDGSGSSAARWAGLRSLGLAQLGMLQQTTVSVVEALCGHKARMCMRWVRARGCPRARARSRLLTLTHCAALC